MEAGQQSISLWLSDVLDSIGVNESTVRERIRLTSFLNTIENIAGKLLSLPYTKYIVGSYIEGTTTIHLYSDIDQLHCCHLTNVIQDKNEMERDKINVLMIQDETVSPGYCYLQFHGFDKLIPLLFTELPVGLSTDRKGRFVFDNLSARKACLREGFQHHGPALSMTGNAPGVDYDLVKALHCKSWPPQVRQWFDKRSEGRWPSEELRRLCSQTACYVVPVGCKGSRNEQITWRISTALAERCLMFDLNMTQIRCYVLMKMILKTYIKPQFGDAISSYMCKTILFHRMASTDPDVWNERNLFSCLQSCLFELHICIENEKCPHFIIHDNNLMSGRFSTKEIKDALLENVFWLYTNMFTALLGIKLDWLGELLFRKSNSPLLHLPKYNFYYIESQLINQVITWLSASMHKLLVYIKSDQYNQVLCYLLMAKFHSERCESATNEQESTVYTHFIQQFSSLMGSTLASAGIQKDNKIPNSALKWIEWGLDTDVSSSRLKHASMFYCIGDMETTEKIISNIQDIFKQDEIFNFCKCETRYFFDERLKKLSDKNVKDNLVESIKRKTAFCVRFLPAELNCIPQELKYEMFRSTREDLALKEEIKDWMDWAVVDSITYLYFLQYKIHAYHGIYEEKQRTLINLKNTITKTTVYLGHKETAWNLLGQCLEQEGRPLDALRCYSSSLKVRERNNAAKIHICRLLSTLISERHCDILRFR